MQDAPTDNAPDPVMTQTATPVVRPMRKDAARNRELLIDAAREVFAARGRDASLDEIAHHAGLGVGTAYRHFANKHEIIAAILDQELEQVVAYAETAARAEDPWAGLTGFFTSILEAQNSNQGLRETLIGVNTGSERGVDARLTGPLNDLLRRAKATGQVREDAEESDIGFVILMLCTVSNVAGDIAPNLWHRYLPMVLDGLRPGGSEFGAPAVSAEELHEAIQQRKKALSRVVDRAATAR
jgi:AcrR family transcriptional regulator